MAGNKRGCVELNGGKVRKSTKQVVSSRSSVQDYTYAAAMGSAAIAIMSSSRLIKHLTEANANFGIYDSSSTLYSFGTLWLPFFLHGLGTTIFSITAYKFTKIRDGTRPGNWDSTENGIIGIFSLGLMFASGVLKCVMGLTSSLWDASSGLYYFGAFLAPYFLYSTGVGLLSICVARWRHNDRKRSSLYVLDNILVGTVALVAVGTSGAFKYLAELSLRSGVYGPSSGSYFWAAFVLPLLLYSLGLGLFSICVAKWRGIGLGNQCEDKVLMDEGDSTSTWIFSIVMIATSVAIKCLIQNSFFTILDTSSLSYAVVLSWMPIFLYSVGIGLLAVYMSQRWENSTVAFSVAGGESEGNGNTMARLQSHLTFLPLIHLIRQHALSSANGMLNLPPPEHPISIQQAGGNGNDKEFLSRLELQRDSFIDELIQSCILPWYEKISDDKIFPARAKNVIQTFLEQLTKKIRKIDRNSLAKEAIEVINFHWTNYCEANLEQSGKSFRFVHEFIENKEELARHYEALTSLLIKELIVPDLQSQIICQFFASILAKNVVMYYVDLVTDPKWINYTIKNIVSIGALNSSAYPEISSLSHGSSQESLPDFTLKPEPEDILVGLSNSIEDDSNLQFDETMDKTPENPQVLGEVPGFKLFPIPPLTPTSDSSATGKQEATVTAALGGLLSTTALTLLPEGSSYNLSSMEQVERTKLEIGSNNDYKGKIVQAKHNPGTEEEDDALWKENLNRFAGDNIANLQTSVTGSIRHYSLDCAKTKSPGLGDADSKCTQSLDDSRSSCSVERQENFEIMMNGLQDTKEGYPKSDVSPLYDEAEDFAATIAKLRSLLEQRESQKNLLKNDTAISNTEGDSDVFAQAPNPNDVTESDPISNTQPEQPITPNSRRSASETNNRPSLNSQSSASSLGSDNSCGSVNSHSSWDVDKLEKIVDELEETGPVLNRFFLNVAIPKTENCSDSSGQFVLYSIQYEGVYVEENDDGQLEKLVLRTTTIKRRFQEFLLLQSQLEESTIWRPHLKGIKAPTKWFSLSFAKSDTTNINQRKVILERYLQQLCYHPVLGFSPLLRQFMAYGEEGFQAFATSDEIPIHRFNKFTKKFTGVFNSLREVLPSFESDLLSAPITSSIDAAPRSPAEMKARNLLALFLREEKLIEVEKSGHASTNTESGNTSSSSTDSKGETGEDGEKCKAEKNDNNEGEENCNSSQTEFAGESVVDEGAMKDAYPLAVAMTNLLCDVLWLPHHRPHSASISTFLSISGKSFEHYLQESLDSVVSQDAWITHLEALTASLKAWGQAEESASLELPEVENVSEAELKNVLKSKIPVWIRWMWGRSRVDMTIDRITKVCQDAKVNQDLVLSLVELVFSKIIDTVEREGTRVE